MPRARLTKSIVDAAEPLESGDLYIWDTGKGAVSGFGLKVTAAGGKTFVQQYRMRGAKVDRRIKIGKFGDWTVEQARDRARELRRDVDAGVDPFDKREAEQRARDESKRLSVDRSFSVVADQFLAYYRTAPREKGARKGRKRSESTIRMVEGAMRMLKAHFGSTRVDIITTGELRACFDNIPGERIATRKNVDASARVFWRWAIERELVQSNLFAAIKSPSATASRDRVHSDDQLALVWRATRKMSYPFAPIFRLLILTGQRREEVSAMDWSEVSKEEKLWRIPGTRTKNGNEQIVPLSADAISELQAIAVKEEWPRAGLIFTVTGKTAVSGHSAAKRRLDAKITNLAIEAGLEQIPAWRVHDFRRTVATGLQRLGIRFEVTEAVLNHSSGSRGGIAGIYSRHDWADEKREALAKWAKHVAALNRPKDISTTSKKAG
jgi:integrase